MGAKGGTPPGSEHAAEAEDPVGPVLLQLPQGALLALHHAVGAGLFALTGRYVWPLLRIAYDSGDYYGTPAMFSFPKWPIFSVICFGCTIMALQYAVMTIGFTRAGWQRRRYIEVDPANKVVS